MPPRKNKDPEPRTQSPARVTRAVARSAARVTRAVAMRASESRAPLYFYEESPTKKRRTKQDDASSSNPNPNPNSNPNPNPNISIVIEHCTQSDSFEARATEAKEGLESKIPNITVILNPTKPRKGCFEIRQEGGETFISLLKMKSPFQPMMDLDMDKVVSDITDKINGEDANSS